MVRDSQVLIFSLLSSGMLYFPRYLCILPVFSILLAYGCLLYFIFLRSATLVISVFFLVLLICLPSLYFLISLARDYFLMTIFKELFLLISPHSSCVYYLFYK